MIKRKTTIKASKAISNEVRETVNRTMKYRSTFYSQYHFYNEMWYPKSKNKIIYDVVVNSVKRYTTDLLPDGQAQHSLYPQTK